jgi:hypothetical protein
VKEKISRSSKIALSSLVAIGLSLTLNSALAADLIKLKPQIDFSESAGGSTNIRNECNLEKKVPGFIGQFSANVQLVDYDEGTDGKVLFLEITGVAGKGGGGWTGKKWLSVKGRLLEKGNELGSFTARRKSGGGFMGGYKGTCSILGRCAEAIAKDISNWLKNPTSNAHLGD